MAKGIPPTLAVLKKNLKDALKEEKRLFALWEKAEVAVNKAELALDLAGE